MWKPVSRCGEEDQENRNSLTTVRDIIQGNAILTNQISLTSQTVIVTTTAFLFRAICNPAYQVLSNIRFVFDHCKNSSQVYGEAWVDMSEPLSQLFRKSCQAQKVSLEMLNKFSFSEDISEQNQEAFAKPIQQLLKSECTIPEDA